MNLDPFRTPVAMSDAGIWALQFDALPRRLSAGWPRSCRAC